MPPARKLGQTLEHQIDQNIRRVYEEGLNDEIPERFRTLLERLRERDTDPKGTEKDQV